MSCVRFTTDAMRQQLFLAVADDQPVAQFLSPAVTESKIRRIELMSQSDNYKIRESAALSYHAPMAVYERLAADKVQSVRECVARNHIVPESILRLLATDSSERVRAFVACHPRLPDDTRNLLLADSSELVRAIAETPR